MDEATSLKPLALTGATGFIGSELQRQLHAAGYPLRALVRPGSKRSPALLAGVQAIEAALSDVDALAAALDGVVTLIYCAGSVRGRDYADFSAANVEGVQAVCRAAARLNKPPHIILISSLAATRPELSHYAHSKCAGEQALRAAPALSWTILRPPAVYGPGDREMLPLFRGVRAGLALIVGPRHQRLSLLHVADLARAVIACAQHAAACDQQVYAIDDGKPGGYSWDDIIAAARGRMPVLRVRMPRAALMAVAQINRMLAGWSGRAPMLTPGKVRELSQASWLCDNPPLTAATAWAPRIGLHAGVAQLFEGDDTYGSDAGAPS